MKSDTVKGYLFALLATLAFSNVYIFSKAALNEVHLAQFGLYWFIIGFSLNFLYAAKNKKLGNILKLPKKQIRILLILAVLEILTTTTFFIAINVISDPSVTSFLGNMYPVFLTIFGIFILKERFTLIESIGMILALAGAFVISYSGGSSIKNLFIPGTGIVFVNALLAASSSIVVKKHVIKISPEIMNLNRTFWLLSFSIVMFFVYGQSFEIPVSALKNIAIGAVLGPFLGILTVYYSFKYIEASRSSIVQSLKGIFVLIGAVIYFETLPLPHQLIGGVLTVVGVFIMTAVKAKLFKKKSPPLPCRQAGNPSERGEPVQRTHRRSTMYLRRGKTLQAIYLASLPDRQAGFGIVTLHQEYRALSICNISTFCLSFLISCRKYLKTIIS